MHLTNLSHAQQKNMRIKIAKDVLKRLRYLDVRRGWGYICNGGIIVEEADDNEAKELFDRKTRKLNLDTEVQDILPKVEKTCQVCALGACFLSHVRFHDNFQVEELDNVDREDITNELEYYFDADQLNLIENCFESNSYIDKYTYSSNDRIINPFAKYTDAKKRLRAIMINIVKNKGTLVV